MRSESRKPTTESNTHRRRNRSSSDERPRREDRRRVEEDRRSSRGDRTEERRRSRHRDETDRQSSRESESRQRRRATRNESGSEIESCSSRERRSRRREGEKRARRLQRRHERRRSKRRKAEDEEVNATEPGPRVAEETADDKGTAKETNPEVKTAQEFVTTDPTPISSSTFSSATGATGSLQMQNLEKPPTRRHRPVPTPMSSDDYQKLRKEVREVYDPQTGRTRLVRGDGEIVERIVSREQQKEINRNATLADGTSFQAHMAARLR